MFVSTKAWILLALAVLVGCDAGLDSSGGDDSESLTEEDAWVEPPAPAITSTPIGQRYGIDWPQDMGETFVVAFIEWDVDSLAEVLVEEHGGSSQSLHRTVGDAFEAGAEKTEWGSNYMHGEHALLLQFKEHYHTIWLFSGPHQDTLKALSREAEVWVYSYDDDFSGADSLALYVDGDEAGMMASSEIGQVRGDFNGRVDSAKLDQARAFLSQIKGGGIDDYSEGMDGFEALIGEALGDVGIYLPRFDNAGDERKHWLTPRTTGGDRDVRAVRLVKF